MQKIMAVIGAGGAIGGAFVRQLAEREEVSTVYAFSRKEIVFASPKIISNQIDITRESSVENAVNNIQPRILDGVLVTTGMLHAEGIRPEKSLREIHEETFRQIFLLNTIGPALAMKHFIPLLNKNGRPFFAALSARVGSISDNRLGGWHAYRSSKAALNMLIKNAAIETARKNPRARILGLHPGTVDSELSKPFQKNIPPEKYFSPDHSVRFLLKVLDRLDESDSGKCFAYDGSEILP